MKGCTVKKNFQEVAAKSFNSEVQTLDFAQSAASAATINGWVEAHTNNKIRDLIAADQLDADSRMVLVNAIYFKGFWKHKFDVKKTSQAPFYLNEHDSVNVDFMKIKEHFKYGTLRDLDATAIELPYKDSGITMMIILPNRRTGLSALEAKMNTLDLGEISKQLYSQEVNVKIPKFRIEMELDLQDTLTKVSCNFFRVRKGKSRHRDH